MRTILHTDAGKECLLQFQRTISVMEGRAIDLIPVEREKLPVTLERILDAIEIVLSVSRIDIMSETRGNQTISDARKIAMYLSNEYVFRSQEECAKAFNRDNHSTVSYAISSAKGLIKSKDKHFIKAINSVLDYINFKYITQ